MSFCAISFLTLSNSPTAFAVLQELRELMIIFYTNVLFVIFQLPFVSAALHC